MSDGISEKLDTFSSRLRYARELRGFKRSALCEAAGLSPSHVRYLERIGKFGAREPTARALSAALNVSLAWLVLGEGDPPTRLMCPDLTATS